MKAAGRTIAALAMLAATLLPVAAAGQPASPHALPQTPGAVPDVPAGPGTIRGRVVHAQNPERASGVPIILYSLSAGGAPGLRGATTGADGSFSFEGVANDPETVYLLGARYAEVPFGTRLSFAADELVREVELPIAEPTSDPSTAIVEEVLMQVEQGCDDLFIRESHLITNAGDRVIYVPEAERGDREPILRISLPAGAAEVQSDQIDDLSLDGETLLFWGPLRPGNHDFEFAYGLPTRSSIHRSLPSGARRIRLLSRPGGPVLSGSAGGAVDLAAAEPLELNGVRFESLEARGVAPDAELAVDVTLPAQHALSDRISGHEARIWHELDGASLTVDQQLRLEVSGEGSLVSESGAPLLCLELPAGAEELRFSTDTLALGLSRDPSGALAIQGPLPAGETQLSLRYRLPVTTVDARVVHTMPVDVPLLSVLVADTGLIVETDRLHRRQPMRTSDRIHMHLEGFEIAGGESIELHLKPLDAARPLPTFASAGLALAAALIAIGFLTGPLRAAGDEGSHRDLSGGGAADERESVLEAIRSLDEDFEVGKLAEADYQEMRDRLRAEAVYWLRQEREAEARPAPTESPRSCPKCNIPVGADARFCSQCGAPLTATLSTPVSSG